MPAERTGLQPYTEKSLTPFSYGLGEIRLTNHEGLEADIQDIVTEFTITESIYGSGLILRLEIKDSANFFEEFKLIGQERIQVRLFRQPFYDPERTELTLNFTVSEYPLYGKLQQSNTHLYSLVALSNHVFNSKLLKISRPVTKESSVEIRNILTDDLSASRFGQFETSNTTFTGVIPWSHPLQAAYWIAQNSYGEKRSPFYLFETLQSGINFRSYSSLVRGETYRTLLDSKQYSANPETVKDYIEKQNRILSITSDFRVSKLIPAVNGAWSNRVSFVDVFEKQISTEEFAYGRDVSKNDLTLEGKSILSSQFKVTSGKSQNENALDAIPEVGTTFIPFNSSVRGYADAMRNKNFLVANSVNTCIDNCVHTITVAGDFGLSAGKVVELLIPKAIDFSAYDKTSWSSEELYDSLLSGRYLITSVIHKFGTEYRSVLTVKKDSLTFDL
jgi:hypothetical protein